MRFVARTPREGINVSSDHPLKEAAILTAGLAGLLVLITALVVSFVDIVIYFIPPETEARVFSGRAIPEFLAADVEDSRVGALESLTTRLARHWPDAPYRFRLGLLEDDAANAIALPGGTILVTPALLDGVESENELAFVLAHELGHFRHRDHLRQLGRGFALGLVLLVVSGHDGGLVTASVVDVASRSFGRRQEADADLYALELMNREYGHVAGATAFFEKLALRATGFENVAGYFATHPAPADRVARLREAAESQGWRTDGPLTPLGF